MKKTLILTLCLIVGLFVFSFTKAQAGDLTLVSSSPNNVTDISDTMIGEMPDDMVAKAYSYPEGTAYGTEYTLSYTVSGTDYETENGPAIALTSGADIQSWSYNATTQIFTVNFITAEFASPFPELANTFIVQVIFPEENYTEGSAGIPVELTGCYISSTVMGWSLVAPTSFLPFFEIGLEGEADTSGFFNLFVSESAINLISQYAGETVSVNELAVYVDDTQSSTRASELNNGGYIDINVTFTEGDTSVTSNGMEYVSKTVKTGQRQPLILFSNKTRVKKGKKVKLSGFIQDAKKGEKVKFLRKIKGKKKYKKIKTVRTNKNGYFRAKIKMKKTAFFKSKHKKQKSSRIKIKVRK